MTILQTGENQASKTEKKCRSGKPEEKSVVVLGSSNWKKNSCITIKTYRNYEIIEAQMHYQVCIIITPCLQSTSLKVLKLRWKSTLWELRPWWKKMVWWRLKSWQIWSPLMPTPFFLDHLGSYWYVTVHGFMVASGHLQVHKMVYIGCDAVRCVIFFRFGFYHWNCVKHQEISIFGDLSKPWKCNKQVKGQCHFISPENEESPHHLTFWVPQVVSCWSWKRFIPNHLGYYMILIQFCYRYVFVGYLLTFFNDQSAHRPFDSMN